MTVFPTGDCPQAGAQVPPLDATATVNDTSPDSERGDMDSMPPNFDEFIPAERFPDMIDVYFDCVFDYRASEPYTPRTLKPQQKCTIKFVRQYPRRATIDKVIDGPDRNCPQKLLTGQLDLRFSISLGEGHHSKVFLAPLTFPSTASKASVRGAVAVKLSNPPKEAREMLLNEAKIYNAFPHDLQRGDVPVVPKFYGCYKPYFKASDPVGNANGSGNLDEEEWTETIPRYMVGGILLLEPCGRAVRTHTLSHSDRVSIGTLVERLHEARFVQESMYERNILIQPGPLNVPYANRSFDKPSYRIIDFGRGINLGVKGFSLEDIEGYVQDEQREARDKGLIPYKAKHT